MRWTIVRGMGLVLGMAAVLAIGVVGAGGSPELQDEGPAPKPTKEHERLKRDVGAWDAVIKSTMPGPDGKTEESESRGVEINRLMTGGLWLITDFRGEFGGMPFHGHGIGGYDPVKKKYVSTWADTFSTSLMVTEGEYDEKTGELTSTGETVDPASGQKLKTRMVSKSEGDDKRSMVMFMQIPGAGDELVKVMEISYTRRPGGPGDPEKKKGLFKREFERKKFGPESKKPDAR
jgi:hypothetical protein